MVLQSLIIAISMYSAIPMPQIEWREDNMRWSLGCLPAVGLLAGGLLYGWSVLGAVTGMRRCCSARWLSSSPSFCPAVFIWTVS